MPAYKIPVVWKESGEMVIEAKDLKGAIKKALDSDEPLPDGEYIDCSIEVNWGVLEFLLTDGYRKLTKKEKTEFKKAREFYEQT